MALKAFVKKLDDVDKAFHVLYEKTTEGFVLNVDDAEYKDKLSEFRNFNISLKEKTETLEAEAVKMKDVDPKKYAEMKETIEELQDKKLLDDGKIDELIDQRTERMRQEYSDKLEKLDTRAKEAEDSSIKYRGQLNTIAVNDAVSKSISDVAMVKKGALTDILSRASQTWSLNDEGVLEARDLTGNILYGKDGKDPLQLKEWSESLSKDAPFLFEPNKGGGAQGSGNPAAGIKVIGAADKDGFSANLEGIATGDIVVQ